MNGLILLLATGLGIPNGWTENQVTIPEKNSEIARTDLRHVVFRQYGTTSNNTQPGQYSFQNTNGTNTSFNSTYNTQPTARTAEAQQRQQQAQQQPPAQQQQPPAQQQQWINPATNQNQTSHSQQFQTTQNQRAIPAFSPVPQTQTNTAQTNQQQTQTTLDSHNGMTSTTQAPNYQQNFSALQSNQAKNLDTNMGSNQYLGLNPLTRPQTNYTLQQPNASFSSFGQQPTQLNQQLYQNRQLQIPIQQQTQSALPNQGLATNPYSLPPNPNANPFGLQTIPGYYQNSIAGILQNQTNSANDALATTLKEALKPMNEKIAALETRALEVTSASQQQLTPHVEISTRKSNSTTILWLLVFGLIGACFYLAWVAQTFYHRYRTLSGEMRETFLERGEVV